MIRIKVLKDKHGAIRGFTVKGHAGAGSYGNDIVCSAVSALAYTAVGALSALARINDYTEQDGYMTCRVADNIPDDKKECVRIILETILIGFKQIEFSYGKYIDISYREE